MQNSPTQWLPPTWCVKEPQDNEETKMPGFVAGAIGIHTVSVPGISSRWSDFQLWAVATLSLRAPSGRQKCLGLDSWETPSPMTSGGGGWGDILEPLKQAVGTVTCWLSEHRNRNNDARRVHSGPLPDNSPSIGHLPSPVSLACCPVSVL